jgi:site-specific DNA-methyltransferase (adenine-specific)
MTHQLFNIGCMDFFEQDDRRWDTLFADPPDNIGLKYDTYDDNLPDNEYIALLRDWLHTFVEVARCVWFSYNAKWTFHVGRIVTEIQGLHGKKLEAKPCVQIFTFGQHRHTDLGNNHRPLIRLRWDDCPLYPDDIRIQSWRQKHGDKRADSRGRVPGDVFGFPDDEGLALTEAEQLAISDSDVYDFTRVVGNSKQRRSYHPTQLNEGLVERCIRLTTAPGENVIDPFGGTGTTLRVCKRIDRNCTLVELDPGYCTNIAAEHEMAYHNNGRWSLG